MKKSQIPATKNLPQVFKATIKDTPVDIVFPTEAIMSIITNKGAVTVNVQLNADPQAELTLGPGETLTFQAEDVDLTSLRLFIQEGGKEGKVEVIASFPK